jgi:hypothetical protein
LIRRLLGLSRLPIFASVILAATLLAVPGRQELLVRVYLLLLAAYALALLLAQLRRANPVAAVSAFDRGLRARPRRRQRLPDLERIERELALARHTAADLHYRLRPRVRRIAIQLLAVRRGLDLDASPEAARSALGDELWALVRADREPPLRRGDAGLDTAGLQRIVSALEAI